MKVISALFICFSPLKSALGFADFSRRLRRRELQIYSRKLALSIAAQIEFIGHWNTEDGVSERFSDEEKEFCVSACECFKASFTPSDPHSQDLPHTDKSDIQPS